MLLLPPTVFLNFRKNILLNLLFSIPISTLYCCYCVHDASSILILICNLTISHAPHHTHISTLHLITSLTPLLPLIDILNFYMNITVHLLFSAPPSTLRYCYCVHDASSILMLLLLSTPQYPISSSVHAPSPSIQSPPLRLYCL